MQTDEGDGVAERGVAEEKPQLNEDHDQIVRFYTVFLHHAVVDDFHTRILRRSSVKHVRIGGATWRTV